MKQTSVPSLDTPTNKQLLIFQDNWCGRVEVVWSLSHFQPYLYGRPFVVQTDHRALQWLHSFKHPEGQIARWLQTLAEYQFSVEHQQGSEHSNVDALSRRPNSHTDESCLVTAPSKLIQSAVGPLAGLWQRSRMHNRVTLIWGLLPSGWRQEWFLMFS